MPFSCILGEIKILFYSPWGCFPVTSQTLFVYLFITSELGLRYCMGFSLAAESWGYSVVVACGLLTAVASVVVEHRLQACGVSSCGSRA